jgi:integrase
MVQRKKSDHGSGSIQERKLKNGSVSFKLRYYVDGRRHTKTVRGTKAEAKKELRRLMSKADEGSHVGHSRLTLSKWAEQWYCLKERSGLEEDGSRKRNRGQVSPRTLERYKDIMRLYILPELGDKPVQRIRVGEVDDLYIQLEKRLSARTVHHVHIVLGSCMKAAVRKGILPKSPVEQADPPSPKESQAGQALDQTQLTELLQGFRETPMFLYVAVAAGTGMRRSEILALEWGDLDFSTGKLSISKSLEDTKEHGLRVKEPKTARGKRVIGLDEALLSLLKEEFELHLRLSTGDFEEQVLDLSLSQLPKEALIFPTHPASGGSIDFTEHRRPHGVTQGFIKRAKRMGFKKLRLHDLRVTHGTLLLNAGVPIHEVARRLGHDPAVLLKTYAKMTEEADEVSRIISGDILRGGLELAES